MTSLQHLPYRLIRELKMLRTPYGHPGTKLRPILTQVYVEMLIPGKIRKMKVAKTKKSGARHPTKAKWTQSTCQAFTNTIATTQSFVVHQTTRTTSTPKSMQQQSFPKTCP